MTVAFTRDFTKLKAGLEAAEVELRMLADTATMMKVDGGFYGLPLPT